jgi:serine/threonine protein kinase
LSTIISEGTDESWSTGELMKVVGPVVTGVLVALIVVLCCTIRKKNIHLQKHIDEQSSNFIDIVVNPQNHSIRCQIDGDVNNLDLNSDLKRQVSRIPYNRKREIKRSALQIDDEIGSGNFGKVYKGQLTGLSEDVSSKSTVAIKSVHETGNSNDILDLLSEIKIMSHIKPHLNLVSMIGSCSSNLPENAEFWLVIEFCQHGDFKNYLQENKFKFLNGKTNEPLNERCLVKWAYHISNGMQYLAENKIMHGDLAARNILMGENFISTECPIAKVADFGLAKKFYEDVKYEKTSRMLVPWKWMAIEYLKNDYLTLQSDVWSYGVLLWEMFSFGKNPYGHQSYDEVLEKLDMGYRLPCPKEVENISSWSPVTFYKELSDNCFMEDPNNRASFSDVSTRIMKELFPEEQESYFQMNESYQKLKAINYLKIGNRSHNL